MRPRRTWKGAPRGRPCSRKRRPTLRRPRRLWERPIARRRRGRECPTSSRRRRRTGNRSRRPRPRPPPMRRREGESRWLRWRRAATCCRRGRRSGGLRRRSASALGPRGRRSRPSPRRRRRPPSRNRAGWAGRPSRPEPSSSGRAAPPERSWPPPRRQWPAVRSSSRLPPCACSKARFVGPIPAKTAESPTLADRVDQSAQPTEIFPDAAPRSARPANARLTFRAACPYITRLSGPARPAGFANPRGRRET